MILTQESLLPCSPGVTANHTANYIHQRGSPFTQASQLCGPPPRSHTELRQPHFPAASLPLSHKRCTESPGLPPRVTQGGAVASPVNGDFPTVRRLMVGAAMSTRLPMHNFRAVGAMSPHIPTMAANATGAAPPQMFAYNLVPRRTMSAHAPMNISGTACLAHANMRWCDTGTKHRVPADNSSATAQTPSQALSCYNSVSDGTPSHRPSACASALENSSAAAHTPPCPPSHSTNVSNNTPPGGPLPSANAARNSSATSRAPPLGSLPRVGPIDNFSATLRTPPRTFWHNASVLDNTPPRGPSPSANDVHNSSATARAPPPLPSLKASLSNGTPRHKSSSSANGARNSSSTPRTPPYPLSHNGSVSDGTPPRGLSPSASVVYSTPPNMPSCSPSASGSFSAPSPHAPFDSLSASGDTSRSQGSSTASCGPLAGSTLLLPTLDPGTAIMCRWEVEADGRRNGACVTRMRDSEDWDQRALRGALAATATRATSDKSAFNDARSNAAAADCRSDPNKFSCSLQEHHVGLRASGHLCRFSVNSGLPVEAAYQCGQGTPCGSDVAGSTFLGGQSNWNYFVPPPRMSLGSPMWYRA